jgi:hypothetical protein
MTCFPALSSFALTAFALPLLASADSSLESRIAASDGWTAYTVEQVEGSSPCCYSSIGNTFSKGQCDLDSRNGTVITDAKATGAGAALAIYWHVDKGRIDRIRAFGSDCPVTSERPVRWIEQVDPAESVATVASWVEKRSGRKGSSDLAALALQADASATRALARMSTKDHPTDLREDALFWLGQSRGVDGADLVEKTAVDDPDPDIREKAVFALSQSSVANAYERVRERSKRDRDGSVRGQALFWMAQMDDPRAAADIESALRSDSDEETREQAVFALSELEDESGTQRLIAIVRGDYPRPIKEKALFWLGQSESDAAIEFLDELLTRQ